MSCSCRSCCSFWFATAVRHGAPGLVAGNGRGSAGAAPGAVAWVLHGLTVIIIPFTISGIVSTLGAPDADRIRSLQQWVTDRADFSVRFDAFEALARSSIENLTSLMPWYWANPFNRVAAYQATAAFLPGFLFLLVYGWRALQRACSHRWALALLRLGFLAAALAPLALNLVGWDHSRWNAVALVNTMTAVLALTAFFPHAPPEPKPLVYWLGAATTCLGLASTNVLFNQVPMHFFPFQGQWDALRHLIYEGANFRPPS